MDAVLQSRTPKHGSGRHHPETAAGHGRVGLLLTTTENGGITMDPRGNLYFMNFTCLNVLRFLPFHFPRGRPASTTSAAKDRLFTSWLSFSEKFYSFLHLMADIAQKP